MKEIMFRAWDDIAKTFYQPGVDELYITLIGAPCTTEKIEGYEQIENRAYRLTLQQYTGLKDKRGVYIYVGDILEWITLKFPITVDSMHGYRFMFGKDQLTKANAVDGEVIGNIHQNPELLE